MFSNYRRLAVLLLAASFVANIAASPSLYAAEGEVTVSPTQDNLVITGGAVYDETMTLLNSGSDAIDVTLYATPYSAKNKQYQPDLTEETARTQLSRWISFPQTEYRLAPSQTLEVPYRVTVPASIPAGGQYAVIFVETGGGTQGSIVTKKRVGMKVFARTDGDTKESGSASFSTLPSFTTSGALEFTTDVKNTGNVDVVARYNTRITTLFGDRIFDETHESVVLPETTRTLASKWSDMPPIGMYTIERTVLFGAQTFTDTPQRIIVVSPLGMVLIAIILIVLITGVRYAVTRPRKHAAHSDK